MTEQNVELDSPLKRLQRESHDNDERLKALESLLQKPQPSFISDWQWNYLKLQHRIMRYYDTVLSYRLEYWDKSPNNEDLLALEYQVTMLGARPLISEILARPLPTAAIDLGEQLVSEQQPDDYPALSVVPDGFTDYRVVHTIPARPVTYGQWRHSHSPNVPREELTRSPEEPHWDDEGFEFYMPMDYDSNTGTPILEAETTWQNKADFLRQHVLSAATAIEVEMPTHYDFPSAFRRLIGGERIARQGWNGKDMWLSVSNLEVNTVPAERFWSKHNRAHALQNGGSAEVPPCVTLKNAKGQVQMGWGPSQEDLFANDWVVLSNGNLHEVAAI